MVEKTAVWSTFGAVSAIIIAGLALANSVNGPAVAIGKLEQASLRHAREITEIRHDLRSNRKDQERVLIVLTALARANGIAIPKKSQMP